MLRLLSQSFESVPPARECVLKHMFGSVSRDHDAPTTRQDFVAILAIANCLVPQCARPRISTVAEARAFALMTCTYVTSLIQILV